MKSQYSVILRHSETRIDPTVPVSEWVLTRKGMVEAEALANSDQFLQYDAVYSSIEQKAIATALPFANKIGSKVAEVKGLEELDRSATYTQSKEEYIDLVRASLTHRTRSVASWESAKSALERFSRAINLISSSSKANRLLIVSHGIVVTLYFAKLMGRLNQAFDRWKQLGFLDWGVVSDDAVLKDIIR